MAQLSLGESRWRMLRRVANKKRFRYEDTRNQTRFDETHFEWLHDNGFLAAAGNGWFELTEIGVAAADLGFYEWEPSRTAVPKKPRSARR